MTVTTDKITDAMAARVGAARRLVDTKVMPYAGPAGRKARQQALEQANHQMRQARVLMQERLVPAATAAANNAMVASAPARREALRRGKLAAAALRGSGAVVVMKKRRRWPVAIGFLAVGGMTGAVIAWLTQAGRPVQLAPYPVLSEGDAASGDNMSDSDMPDSDMSDDEETVDLTSQDEPVHHES
jgi:hypothetical protein